MVKIPASSRTVTYNPVASAGPFPVGSPVFPVFDPSGSDLYVTLDGAMVTNWTFAGTLESGFYGAPNTWVEGSITFDAPISGVLVIDGRRDPRRQGQFAEGGGIPARDHNTEYNILTATDQELRRDIDREVAARASEISRVDLRIDGVEDRLDEHDARLDGHDESFVRVEKRVDRLEVIIDDRNEGGDSGLLLRAFPTRGHAEAYRPVLPPPQIQTLGFATPSDGGGVVYEHLGTTNPGHVGCFGITLQVSGVVHYYGPALGHPLNVQMFGASASKTPAQNTDIIEAAISWCQTRRIWKLGVAMGPVLRCLGRPDNFVGVGLYGPGTLVESETGEKLNNADIDRSRDVVGDQHTRYWRWAVRAGSTARFAIHGNSIATWGPWQDLLTTPAAILKRMAHAHGVSACEVLEHAVGGTGLNHFIDGFGTYGWEYDANVYGLLLFYGINEGGIDPKGDNVEWAIARLREAATLIREARPDNLTVWLPSPITGTESFLLNGDVAGRDEQWVEKLLNGWRQVAEEFSFVYVDVYSPWRDMRRTDGGAIMDTLSDYNETLPPGQPWARDDAHIHPRSEFASAIWVDGVGKSMFPESLRIYAGTNIRINLAETDPGLQPTALSPPAHFDVGQVASRALPSGQAWPFNGGSLTDKHPGGFAWQLNYHYADGNGGIRFGTGEGWGRWHIFGWWEDPETSLSFGAGVAPGTETSGKVVQTGGAARGLGSFSVSGDIVPGQLLLTVPPGRRPAEAELIVLSTNAGPLSAWLVPNGQITAAHGISAPGFFSIASSWLIGE